MIGEFEREVLERAAQEFHAGALWGVRHDLAGLRIRPQTTQQIAGINRDFENETDIVINGITLLPLFLGIDTSYWLRLAIAKTVASVIQHHGDWLNPVANEYGFAYAHSLRDATGNNEWQPFHINGLLDLGSAMEPKDTPNLVAGDLDRDPSHQIVAMLHSHPPFISKQLLGPSVIEERPGINPFGDLVGLFNNQEHRYRDEREGRRPRFVDRVVHAVVQPGVNIEESVHIMVYRQSELLADLSRKDYYSWLRLVKEEINKVNTPKDVALVMRSMGFLVGHAEISGEDFWESDNVFENTYRSDLLNILKLKPDVFRLKRYLDEHGVEYKDF